MEWVGLILIYFGGMCFATAIMKMFCYDYFYCEDGLLTLATILYPIALLVILYKGIYKYTPTVKEIKEDFRKRVEKQKKLMLGDTLEETFVEIEQKQRIRHYRPGSTDDFADLVNFWSVK